MKKLGLFCLLAASIGFQSCKKNEVDKTANVQLEEPVSVQCYTALYQKDTVELKVNTMKDGKITGNMVMKFLNMPKKDGTLVGEFRGDTLFASYTFIQGSYKKKTFKNPMAFLKKGDQLIIGNGKIETSLGASYFIKGEPIDFERVKYKLSPVDCVEE